MCLTAVALGVHEDYPLVIIANRDEFHNRPALPMHWWQEGRILAGKDLAAGGTWLGITDTGHFAMLTNVRNPALQAGMNAPSRGQLVTDFLLENQLPDPDLDVFMAGYNLIHGNLLDGQLSYQSNQFERLHGFQFPPTTMTQGIYTLSNASLTTTWPKTKLLGDMLAHLLEHNKAPTHSQLLALLQDRDLAPDEELPETGVPQDWEKMLSAIKIISSFYGTRCSTVITKRSDGEIMVTELTYTEDGTPCGQVQFVLN